MQNYALFVEYVYICSKTIKKRHQLINKQQAFSAGRKKGTAKLGIDLLFKLREGVCYCYYI